MNNRKYFYCGSTQALLYALAKEEFIIISDSKASQILCEIYDRKLISVGGVNNKLIIKNPFYIYKQIKRIREIIDEGELHFSHTQFALFCFILVDKLAKRNINIVFHNFEFVYKKVDALKTIFKNPKQFLRILFVELVYGVNLEYRYVNNILVPAISDDFLKNHQIKAIENKSEYYSSTLSLFKKSPIKNKDCENLFLTQNLLKYSLFKKEDVLSLYEYLRKQNIKVKLHPGTKEKEELIFKGMISDFEKEIPVEFLFNSVSNAIVSVHSAALITASKFESLKSISLLDLLKSGNEEFKRDIKNDLILKSDDGIIFPKTFSELKALLND